MPEVPTVDAPTVTQSGAPINVSTPSEAFGASVVGAGLSQTGQTVQQGSDMLEKHAEAFQALNNKAEADGAFVTHLQDVNQFAANYQANNRGIAAMNNLPDAMKAMDAQRTAISATLSNPMSQAMFDADSRRATANVTGELTRFAVAQRKEYLIKQNVAVQEASASDTVIHPDQFGPNMAKMQEQQVLINAQLGLSKEEGELEARKLFSNTVAMVSETMAGTGNISAASKFLDDHKEGMDGKIYTQTLMKLKPALLANDVATVAEGAVSDAVHGVGTSPIGSSVDYLTNVHGREGDAKNPNSTADGIGQFTQGTWLHLMKTDPQFAKDIAGKSDADILEQRHNPDVANRAILSYAQSNASILAAGGYNVNATSVGLLHGYGPGDGPKILSALDNAPDTKIDTIIGAQTAKNNNVSGQTVTQVVQGFQKRFGTAAAVDSNNNGTPTSYQLAARLDTILSLVDQRMAQLYPGNEQLKEQAEEHAKASLGRQVNAVKANESEARDTLVQFASDNHVQDLPTLLKTVPGGLQMYNALPSSQAKYVDNMLRHNANDLTAQRAQSAVMLDGMYASRDTDPNTFASQDLTKWDLTRDQYIKYSKLQSTLANKATVTDPNAKALTEIVKMPEYKSILGSDGLDIKPNSPDEFALRGAIAGQLTLWHEANKGKTPQPADYLAMIARATAQHSYHNTFLGMQYGDSQVEQTVPEVPENHKAAIIAALTKNNIPVTPYTINKYYSMKKGLK